MCGDHGLVLNCQTKLGYVRLTGIPGLSNEQVDFPLTITRRSHIAPDSHPAFLQILAKRWTCVAQVVNETVRDKVRVPLRAVIVVPRPGDRFYHAVKGSAHTAAISTDKSSSLLLTKSGNKLSGTGKRFRT